jgi:Sulfotransferase family
LGIKKNHAYARDRPRVRKMYSFAFVRHPVTRLISWYNHLRKHLYFDPNKTNKLNSKSTNYNSLKSGKKMGPIPHRKLAVRTDLNNWIKIILTNPSVYALPHWGPLSLQYNYIYGKKGKKLVTDVLRFENYTDELAKVLNKLKKHYLIDKIQKTNQSQKTNDVLQEDTLRLIYKYFSKDFATFGYDCNDPTKPSQIYKNEKLEDDQDNN